MLQSNKQDMLTARPLDNNDTHDNPQNYHKNELQATHAMVQELANILVNLKRQVAIQGIPTKRFLREEDNYPVPNIQESHGSDRVLESDVFEQALSNWFKEQDALEDSEYEEGECVDTMGMNSEPKEDGLFQMDEPIELLPMPFFEEEFNSGQEGGFDDYLEVMDGGSKSCDLGQIKGGKAMDWRSNKNVKGKDPLDERVYLFIIGWCLDGDQVFIHSAGLGVDP
eukprot:Gb_38040 [translate_table: standard]